MKTATMIANNNTQPPIATANPGVGSVILGFTSPVVIPVRLPSSSANQIHAIGSTSTANNRNTDSRLPVKKYVSTSKNTAKADDKYRDVTKSNIDDIQATKRRE